VSEVVDGSRPAAAGPLRGPRRALVLCAALGVFAVQLDFFSVQASVPEMADDLDSTSAALQWVVSGYMLSSAAFLVVAGRLADIFGRRAFLVVGAAIFGGASLLGGAAGTPELPAARSVVVLQPGVHPDDRRRIDR
jgi:MFS family permease